MLSLAITPDEVQSGRLTPDHLAAAINAIHIDGFVVLEDIVDLTHIEALREVMLADVDGILKRDDVPFNFTAGNIQQGPPPFPPYLYRDIVTNDLVISVTKGVLGPGLRNSSYSGNTALPSDSRQPVHGDIGQIPPTEGAFSPYFALVVNIPIVDVDWRNGSTEIWPGTHVDLEGNSIHAVTLTDAVLDKRRAVVPPLQPAVRAGSVLIRDMRLWHAGMPNHTETPRPMIAMVHKSAWWSHPDPVRYGKGAEEIVGHPDLAPNEVFVDAPFDYIRHGASDMMK